MVYKIIGKFTDDNFFKIVDKVSARFKFIYCNDTLYISMKNVDSLEKDREYLYKIFKPARDFFITEITEQNIFKESEIIVEWCRDNLVLLEKQKFEKEQQSKLRSAWLAMDNMESQLKSEMLKRKQK